MRVHYQGPEAQGPAPLSSQPNGSSRKAQASTDHQAGVSRRTFLKGAALLGGSLAAAGGIAVSAQHSSSQAAAAQTPTSTPGGGQIREYWIQADSFFHNLVPTGKDGLMGMTYTPS